MAAVSNKAKFKVVGNTTSLSSAGGYYAVVGESLSLQLEDTTSVGNATWELYDPASASSPLASLNAPTFVFTGNSLPLFFNGVTPFSAAVVAPTPTAAQPVSNTYFVRCTVATDGGQQSFVRSINVVNGLTRKSLPGESTENSSRGWSDDLAALVEASGHLRYLVTNGTDVGMEIWLKAGTPAANIRVSQTWVASLTTSDATVTTALTLAMPSSKLFSLALRWHGRSGSNELLRESTMVFRRIATAAPTQWGSTVDIFPTTKDDAAWGTPGVVVSGNNLLVQLTGKAATSIVWDVEATWRDL